MTERPPTKQCDPEEKRDVDPNRKHYGAEQTLYE